MKKFNSFFLIFCILASALVIPAASAAGQAASVVNTTALYAGTDDLGRKLTLSGEANGEKEVGIFYFLWEGKRYPENGPYDVSEILKNNSNAAVSNEAWLAAGGGATGYPHWWGKSLFGYFRSYDRWVLTRDLQMLTDAGIDFIAIDYSNAQEYTVALLVLLEVWQKYYEQGYDVPKITFITKADSAAIMQSLYEKIYTAYPQYTHLWYKMDGKPLMVGYENEEGVMTEECKNYFTFRFPQWPREAYHEDGFPWMDFSFPQQIYGTDTTIMSVSVAQHKGTRAFSSSAFYGDTANHTRSWHDGANDTAEDAYLYGYNFAEQFENAIEQDPDVIFITGWNEWIANRQPTWDDMSGSEITDPVILVDNADINNSRDIQPMNGGYGDNYYMQMIDYIRKFKGVKTVNSNLNTKAVVQSAVMDVSQPFVQWEAVEASYLDYTGEIDDRDEQGYGNIIYQDTTGRNDFSLMKVANDSENLYFYAKTVSDIKGNGKDACMSLFLNTGIYADSWNGYDIAVGRRAVTAEGMPVERFISGNWQIIGYAPYLLIENQIQLSLPLNLIGYDNTNFSLQFKWADNYDEEEGIYSFYLHGDAAPYGRLNYVYNGVTATSAKVFCDFNSSGKSDIIDFIILKKALAADNNSKQLDINVDGSINALDLIWMRKKLLGCLDATNVIDTGKSIAISSATVCGSWVESRTDSELYGIPCSYDGDSATRWNPQASPSYVGDPGIIYCLDGCYDVKQLHLQFSARRFYFTVSTSTDGEAFDESVSVTSGNASFYYEDGGFDCRVFLNGANVKYIKLTFAGSSDRNVWIALNEINVYGSETADLPHSLRMDDRPVNKAGITAYTITGTYVDSKVDSASIGPEKTFDNNTLTFWNPRLTDYESGEGIIYMLDQPYDITKISLTFSVRRYYFEVSVSEDGENFFNLTTVDGVTAVCYYRGYECIINGFYEENIRYVKLRFLGNSYISPYVIVHDVSIYGKEPQAVYQKANIIADEVVGVWALNRVGSSSIGPQNTYDTNIESYWNPQATNYRSGEGIVYTLDNAYDLRKLYITFGSRFYYFDVYVSSDAIVFKKVLSVTAENYMHYYTDDYLCRLANFDFSNVRYIRLMFNGNSQNSMYSTLYDIKSFGILSSSSGNESEATVTGHSLVGTWVTSREGSASIGPQLTYDGNIATRWNPQATNYKCGEGIVYSLEKTYNLSEIVLTFGSRIYYFDLYVSSDGEHYGKVASVTSANADNYYSGLICTLDGFKTSNSNFIKLVFTGNAGSVNTYITLCEVLFVGSD